MTVKNNEPLVAIIAEGNTEQAILDVLLQHCAIKYEKDNLLQQQIIRCRSGRSFAKHYLNKGFDQKIKIIRVLDSRNENFKLPGAYAKKVYEPINLYTRPEIEILYILYHNDYPKFEKWCNKKGKSKPSIFVKEHYHDLERLKTYKDNFDFWNNHFDELLKVLREYKTIRRPGEKCIADLLVE